MTLDEAIQHCEEVAKEQEHSCKCNDSYDFSQPKWKKCAKEHRQLASWLKQLQEIQEIIKSWEGGTLEVQDSVYAFRKIREVLK